MNKHTNVGLKGFLYYVHILSTHFDECVCVCLNAWEIVETISEHEHVAQAKFK